MQSCLEEVIINAMNKAYSRLNNASEGVQFSNINEIMQWILSIHSLKSIEASSLFKRGLS